MCQLSSWPDPGSTLPKAGPVHACKLPSALRQGECRKWLLQDQLPQDRWPYTWPPIFIAASPVTPLHCWRQPQHLTGRQCTGTCFSRPELGLQCCSEANGIPDLLEMQPASEASDVTSFCECRWPGGCAVQLTSRSCTSRRASPPGLCATRWHRLIHRCSKSQPAGQSDTCLNTEPAFSGPPESCAGYRPVWYLCCSMPLAIMTDWVQAVRPGLALKAVGVKPCQSPGWYLQYAAPFKPELAAYWALAS